MPSQFSGCLFATCIDIGAAYFRAAATVAHEKVVIKFGYDVQQASYLALRGIEDSKLHYLFGDIAVPKSRLHILSSLTNFNRLLLCPSEEQALETCKRYWPFRLAVKEGTLNFQLSADKRHHMPVIEAYALLVRLIHEQALSVASPTQDPERAMSSSTTVERCMCILIPESLPASYRDCISLAACLANIPLSVMPSGIAALSAFKDFVDDTVWGFERVFLIHDFGASKLSVSCYTFHGNSPKLLSAECLFDLGGQDLDNAIMDIFFEKLQSLGISSSILKAPTNFFRIRQQAVSTKHDLSLVEEVLVSLSIYVDDDERDISFLFKRAEFEQNAKASSLFRKAVELVERVLGGAATEAHMTVIGPSHLVPIAVGGCFAIPKVRRDLEEKLRIVFPQKNIVTGAQLVEGAASVWHQYHQATEFPPSCPGNLAKARLEIERHVSRWKCIREVQSQQYTLSRIAEDLPSVPVDAGPSLLREVASLLSLDASKVTTESLLDLVFSWQRTLETHPESPHHLNAVPSSSRLESFLRLLQSFRVGVRA